LVVKPGTDGVAVGDEDADSRKQAISGSSPGPLKSEVQHTN
jgi:hypothetical protein